MYKWRNIYTFIIILAMTATVYGGPVKDHTATYIQPDGTTFRVKLRGDEWFKLRTTEDGCAIIKDADGWWCYGIYDISGSLASSGHHVGKSVPQEVISLSRNIPYGSLSQKAAERRAVNGVNSTGPIAALRRQAAATRSGSTKIQKRGIALLVQFNDTRFKFTKADFEALLNQKGYQGTGSVKDYYENQFGENWEFTFDVSDILTLSWPAEHYGGNDADGADIRPWDMVAEACRQADEEIDFSLYDQDGDGEVDNVYVFYAGKCESEHTDQPELIWPHQYYIYSGTPKINLILDGKRINRYACSSEISGERSFTGIGSFCHEYGHTLGLKDLYDTNYDKKDGWAAGVWKTTSLMDGGNYNNNSATPPHFNCIEREILGLSEPVVLEAGRSYSLEPIHENGLYYRLDTDVPGEYYLFECRSNDNWDRYIGGEGMLVYHIDKNEKEMQGSHSFSRWDLNTVNASVSHQCADLIEADGRSDEIRDESDFRKDISGIFFPQDNATSITPTGIPQLRFWSGEKPEVSVTGIRRDGKVISFMVSESDEAKQVPSVADISFTAFPDAAIIRFSSSDTSLEGTPVLTWRRSGSDDEFTRATAVEYAEGQYVCKLEGLESGNVTYEVKITFMTEGTVGNTGKLSFMTKRKPAVTWPYIYISDSSVQAGKGIDLHIVNAENSAAITWSYNGKVIDTEKDPRFFPAENGTLEATVLWKNGSIDIIQKKLEIIR